MRNKMIIHNLLLFRLVIGRTQIQLITLFVLCFSGSLLTSICNADELDQTILYSYKIGKFATWPDKKLNTATKHFQLCILGWNPFSQQALNMIIGKPVQGIPLSIETFNSGLITEKVLSTCHIVFISSSEKHRLSTILSSLQKIPVLTVSDIHGFSDSGGMITLVKDHGKLRFQINQKALQQANISVSSKIIELAEIIDVGR